MTKADTQTILSKVNLSGIKHLTIMKAYGNAKASQNFFSIKPSSAKFTYLSSSPQITGNDTRGNGTEYTLTIPYANIRCILYNKTWILQIHMKQ
ncbi:hypothetical protein [uncultured Microscilla sp.]|uniref:hypothetical protein n=1 Tax=uncultured Microscilla sp. TaxID=432653 RepID=UPI00260C49D4|nr:hypothetical protein [uncultured Microscilla sp.]